MQISTSRNFYLSLIILLMFPVAARAIPAVTCHCFTDRSYDPAHPTLADPYFLATTQNSFFAAAFAVDKKTIVIKKQKGTSAADLWISYWLACKTGADPEPLLQTRKTTVSWRQVAAPLQISAKLSGTRFAEALKTNATDDGLACIVVDELLLRFRVYKDTELAALRGAGAGNEEVILACLIASRTRQPAIQLYLEVKKGSKSWGALLDRAKIDPADIQNDIKALLTSLQIARWRTECA